MHTAMSRLLLLPQVELLVLQKAARAEAEAEVVVEARSHSCLCTENPVAAAVPSTADSTQQT